MEKTKLRARFQSQLLSKSCPATKAPWRPPFSACSTPPVALGDQLLTSGSSAPDSLDAQVVYDDGSIQEWADATYGDGLVRISSALLPVEG